MISLRATAHAWIPEAIIGNYTYEFVKTCFSKFQNRHPGTRVLGHVVLYWRRYKLGLFVAKTHSKLDRHNLSVSIGVNFSLGTKPGWNRLSSFGQLNCRFMTCGNCPAITLADYIDGWEDLRTNRLMWSDHKMTCKLVRKC